MAVISTIVLYDKKPIRKNGIALNNNVLITGVNGFVGSHMAAKLLKNGHRVVGIGRDTTPSTGLEGLYEYFACDLTIPSDVNKLMPQLRAIDVIIHLAGIATTNNSPLESASVLRTNVEVHRILYQALLDIKSKVRIIAVSTGLVYEQSSPIPFTESSALMPDTVTTNPYIRSKLQVETVAQEYRDKGLDIYTVRPFNHTGPGQGLGFFVPDQVAKIKAAKASGAHMELGDAFDFWRDFTDVRDVCNAYRLLVTTDAKKLTATTYNIASGTPVYGRDLFRMLAKELDFTDYSLSADDGSASPVPRICGDANLLRKDTAWGLGIGLEQTIRDYITGL